jgi:SAM-dependent methyltransferase
MSISRIYSNQYRWRRWSGIYPALGDVSGTLVLDLGCGIGDQARDLSMLGAQVLGIDANQDMIDHANQRGVAGARFLCDDVRNLKAHALKADGVWASFTAAYFPQFDELLDCIDTTLKPGGWLAITELDDLFGHEPLASRWAALAERYYADSLEEGTYRFRSHDHVCEVLTRRGWRIEIERTLEDDEFCFTGPADAGVADAWKTRLGFMMPRFLDRYGTEATGFDSAFLECLTSEEHRSRSHVWFILARRPNDGQNANK